MIHAANNNIVVLAEDKPTTTKSGLAIPVVDKNNDIVKGVVVSVGWGKRDRHVENEIPSFMDKGLNVWFPRFNATEVMYENQKYLIIDESYILAFENTNSK